MSHDHLLVRTHNDVGWNLAVGEPFCVRDALWRNFGIPHPARTWDTDAHAYPQLGGQPQLLELLQRRHGSLVVIANGAKQAIAAALYAFRTMFEKKHAHLFFEDRMELCHEKPYWVSYPTLASHAGMDFTPHNRWGQGREWFVNVVTTPNNPDGSQIFDGAERYDIWDAAYASPLYNWNGQTPKHRVAIWSAAKMFGLSGARIGWLTTADPDIARLAAEYIEQTTSGVSLLSQELLLGALKEEGTISWGLALQRAQEALRKNGEAFLEHLSGHCERYHGVPHNMVGMFSWFRVREPERFARALKNSQVKLVPGNACGYVEQQPASWYRMSMGHHPAYTQQAMVALRKALNE